MIKERAIKTKDIIIFYILSFGIAWIFWVPMALDHLKVINFGMPLLVGQSIGAFAPLFSVLIMSRIIGDKGIFSDFFNSIKKTKEQISLAVFAALFALVIAVLITAVYWALYPDQAMGIIKPKIFGKYGYLVIGLMLVQFLTALIGSPLGEEIGWRGFALVNIKSRTGRLLASAIVGILWWIWHLPLFIVLNVPINIGSCLEMVGFSFVIDTLFLYSGNNLLIAMLSHQSTNTKFTFFSARTTSSLGLLVLWIAGIAIYLFMARGKNKSTETD